MRGTIIPDMRCVPALKPKIQCPPKAIITLHLFDKHELMLDEDTSEDSKDYISKVDANINYKVKYWSVQQAGRYVEGVYDPTDL